MSEMIERGALAIKAIVDRHNSADHTFRFSTPEEIMEGYRAKARAAIEAMREPTDEMISAGERVYDSDTAYAKWKAMIDAALSEKPQDITVGCKCGWQGRQSKLVYGLCPTCGEQFKAWP